MHSNSDTHLEALSCSEWVLQTGFPPSTTGHWVITLLIFVPLLLDDKSGCRTGPAHSQTAGDGCEMGLVLNVSFFPVSWLINWPHGDATSPRCLVKTSTVWPRGAGTKQFVFLASVSLYGVKGGSTWTLSLGTGRVSHWWNVTFLWCGSTYAFPGHHRRTVVQSLFWAPLSWWTGTPLPAGCVYSEDKGQCFFKA